MPTHCLKIINGIPNQAQINEIKDWKKKLISKGHFPKEEKGEKIYFEGSEEECKEALNQIDYRTRPLFSEPIIIDYMEEE